jgi:hypothetical protein
MGSTRSILGLKFLNRVIEMEYGHPLGRQDARPRQGQVEMTITKFRDVDGSSYLQVSSVGKHVDQGDIFLGADVANRTHSGRLRPSLSHKGKIMRFLSAPSYGLDSRSVTVNQHSLLTGRKRTTSSKGNISWQDPAWYFGNSLDGGFSP